MEETERSLHDAIMIVRRAIKNDSIVAGTYQTRVPAAQGKPGKFVKTRGILFAQVMNTPILKIRDIVKFAAKFSYLFSLMNTL